MDNSYKYAMLVFLYICDKSVSYSMIKFHIVVVINYLKFNDRETLVCLIVIISYSDYYTTCDKIINIITN